MNFLPFRPKKGEAFTAYLSPEFLTSAYLASDVDWSAHDCFISKNGGKFYPTTNKPQNIERNGINRVMTSVDGESFTSVDFGSAVNLVYVDYVDSNYLAIGESDNNLYVSEDGVTWTPKNVGFDVRSLVKSGDYYIAAGVSGVKRSLDLDTWEDFGLTVLPEANTWKSIVYAAGLFVAVAYNGTNRVVTSPDGITWTPRTAAEANAWLSVTYGDELFVAVSYNGTNRVMTSPDGITWTPRTAAEANSWQSVTYGNSLFIAVASDGANRVMTSTDGITWNTGSTAENNQWFSIVYGGGKFVSVAKSSKEKFTRGKGVLSLTATEMNANHIILTLDELNSTSCISQSVIIYTDGAEDINVGGGGSEDVGVINFPPAVLNLIIAGLSDNFVLAKAQLQANGHNYYGLRKNNATYLIVKENITSGVLTYAYRSINVGKTFPNAWNSKTNITYSSTQNVI